MPAQRPFTLPEALELKPIGILESCFQEKFGTPRQPGLVPGSAAKLRIFPKFAPEHSLEGLDGFSHVWLLAWFHLSTNKTFHPKIHPPRLKGGKIGVFASRSPHRPNPVGLSLAKLERVEGGTLFLSGVDLINGTPILDIKPYLPDHDRADGVRAGWAEKNAFPELEVKFSPRARADVARVEASGYAGMGRLISDTLRHDPRNMRDKTQMADGVDMGFFLANHDVHFSVKGRTATVLRIETGARFEKKFRREKPRPA
ncbi:MAG: tRNA (N6-threonylcarbamoyladenosine(37)-N6)-methyltransferase TrmO [Elusimicrobia bacterium CG08_land_8_20_14_0_20_59_10]|nr:MAG: tRNA (N6-threonylcarbamoyladenosine(37)-N6)-methyltransferase TrmO [Elusimicrobia bacterium CG08_land_8_20_14_0_20_59_10]